MNPPTLAGACSGPDCRRQHEPRERVALATEICRERGVQMTELRRGILEFLWESHGPASAYQLMAALKQREARLVGPPTVYRALAFLMAQGLATKIESLNAYVPCIHPERDHDCLFFLCRGCRTSVEFENPRISTLLAEDAAVLGFVATRRKAVGVEGTCARCIDIGAA